MSPSSFITLRLAIEETQYVFFFHPQGMSLRFNLRQSLKSDASNESVLTATQETNLQQCCAALLRQIRHFHQVQAVYMINIEDIVSQRLQNPATEAEDICLFLPSRLHPTVWTSSCTNNIAIIEEQLREAQCHNALAKLRTYLHTRTHCIKHQNTNICGQGANTHVKTLVDALLLKIARVVEKYQAAHAALLALCGVGSWECELQPLQSKDICGPTTMASGDIDDTNDNISSNGHVRSKKQLEALRCGLGEGYQTMSWIWACRTITSGNEEITDGKPTPMLGKLLST